ncbi:MAG: hypothetical protein Crog4KO_00960 [Crocinitomicaceae bacterium]
MKHLLSLLVALSFCLPSQALELPYKQLKKTYENEYDKTLDRAELWMKLLPNNPAAYYYASLVYFEEAQGKESIRKRYLGLVKSLRYARELEKLNDQEFLDAVQWDTLTPLIQGFTVNVTSDLKEAELFKLADLVDRKARRFDWMDGKQEESNLASNESKSSAPEKKIVSEMRDGQYFGMPTGNESIDSYSIRSEREMLEYINKERLEQGMQALSWNEDLARAARYHAYDMGSQNYFDHNSHDRNNGELKQVGYTFSRIRTFYTENFVNSENIAAGNEGALDTYTQWYNSKGHYENMFNPSSSMIGVGVIYVPGSTYGYYWVMCTAMDW